MAAALIIFFVILIGCIIRYSMESNTKKEAVSSAPVKHISEWTIEELQSGIEKADIEIEMQKIKYQGSLSNPYVLHVTRDLIKHNLENSIRLKSSLMSEMNKRNNSDPQSES